MQVTLEYKKSRRRRHLQLQSPWSRQCAKRIAKRKYPSLAKSVTRSSRTNPFVISAICNQIRREMQSLCARQQTSMIGYSIEGIENFNLEAVWHEFSTHVPTLAMILQQLVTKKKAVDYPLMSLIGCMLLKKRSQKMSLFQKAISVFFCMGTEPANRQ